MNATFSNPPCATLALLRLEEQQIEDAIADERPRMYAAHKREDYSTATLCGQRIVRMTNRLEQVKRELGSLTLGNFFTTGK